MAEGERRLPRFAPAAVVTEKLPDGGLILRSPRAWDRARAPSATSSPGWASWMPHRVFLAEREGEGWRRVTPTARRMRRRARGRPSAAQSSTVRTRATGE